MKEEDKKVFSFFSRIEKDEEKFVPLNYRYIINNQVTEEHKHAGDKFVTNRAVRVDYLNSDHYLPQAHHKPISKIIDLSVFDDE